MSPGEHDHEHAEAFPRAETAALVSGELESEAKRARWQTALVALAITLLALGLPSGLVFGRTIELVESTARGEWSGPHLFSQALAALLHALGMRAEPAWFLLSAVGFGAATWVLLRGAARNEWPAGPRLLALGVIVFTPVAILAATTPSAAGLECFGASLVFESLRSSENEQPKPSRMAWIWLFATLMHAWNALLLPAVVVACGRRGWPPLATALVLWFALVVGVAAIGGASLTATLDHLGRTMLAGGSGGPGPFLGWIGICAFGLGGGAMGWLAAFVLGARGKFDRPPAWMFVFGLAPLVVLGLGGVATWDVPCLWLVPPAYLGLVVLLHSRQVSALPLLVILGLVGAAGVLSGSDDLRGLRAAIERVGHDGLVVLVSEPARVYVLEQRYDLEAIDVSPAYALDPEKRAAFFTEVEARIAALRAQGRTVRYDPSALHGRSTSWIGSDSPMLPLDALVRRTGIQPLP